MRLIAIFLFLFCFNLIAAKAESNIEVDVELVLAVDVSRSMTQRELEIQRRGYAEALVSRPVVDAIGSGLIGRIALQYVEWSGYGQQRIIVDWTLVKDAIDAADFANKLTTHFNSSLRKTSISDAITYSARGFETNGFSSNRQVIDISGDGPNNSGIPVNEARDKALNAGIIINGLPLMTREGMGSNFHLANLDNYYRDCVVGGPGSFVIPVNSWEQFPAAVRQKLVLELANHSPQPPVVMASSNILGSANSDCLVGEKMWEQLIKRYPSFNVDP